MLAARLHKLNIKDPMLYQLPDKAMTYVKMLRPAPVDWVFASAIASWLPSKKSIASLTTIGCMKSNTAFVDSAIFAPYAMATYFASP